MICVSTKVKIKCVEETERDGLVYGLVCPRIREGFGGGAALE